MTKINNIRAIGVISDTHIPGRADTLPDKITQVFMSVDIIIHCGDIVSNEVLFELGVIAPIYAVRGNMDSSEIMEPAKRILEINGKYVLCISHGSGPKNGLKERVLKQFSSLNPYMILYGHSHIADYSEHNGIYLFNPGSATNGADKNTAGILRVTSMGIKPEIIEI